MISYSVQFPDISNIINQIDKDLADLSDLMEQAGVYMLGSVDRNFRAGGRPTRWKPLAPSTIARRRKGRGAGSPKPLLDRGILRASISAPRAKGNVFEVGKLKVTIGTNIEYARTHQFGRPAIPNVAQTVDAHRRKPHQRKVGGKTVNVGGSFVKSHERTVTLPAIPARPFLLFQHEDFDKILEIAKAYFDNKMRLI